MRYIYRALLPTAAAFCALQLAAGPPCSANNAPGENTSASLAATVLASPGLVVQEDRYFPPANLRATGSARVKGGSGHFELKIDDPAGECGAVLEPPKGGHDWDFSGWTHIAVEVKNLSARRQMRLVMELTGGQEGAPPRRTNAGIGLNPGEQRTLRLPLPHQWKYSRPEGVPGVRAMDTAHITQVAFFMQWPFEERTSGLMHAGISQCRLEGFIPEAQRRAVNMDFPFIDRYGQFVHADWPEKVKSAADLERANAVESNELAQSQRPAAWNRFGGWRHGPLLSATGYFRTQKYRGKWYLVDPEGRLFFSHGINVINQGTETLKVLPGKESWFQSLEPGAKSYGATAVALREKYGTPDFAGPYFEKVNRRLEAWGMNTIGDWSSIALMATGQTPYTLQLTDYDWKMPRIAGSKLKFYDVFDPVYVEKMRTLIETQAAKEPLVAKSLTDPMCIGYFIDNELNFGNRGRMTLVDDIMKSPASQAAKMEFAATLKERYVNIGALNGAWKTQYEDWNALRASTEVPQSDGYRADANTFFLKMVDQYFRLARMAVKSVAPHRLYLGARFISTDSVRPALYKACERYSDILSVNIYAHSAANFPAENLPDMPVMITEFQFGILQRGMFSASLCSAGTTPADRGMAYMRFLQGALVHPNVVGAHYFQFRDQPLTGRGDGEAYQIGFVDVADTPYPELTAAARQVGENMYQYRINGKLANRMH